jgi:hypothetical protein
LGIQHLHIEGDALEIVQALLLQESCWSRYGFLVEDTRTLLNSFQSWQVSHVRREANEVAHRLAKVAITQSLNYVWRDSPPSFIHSIVLAEQEFPFD